MIVFTNFEVLMLNHMKIATINVEEIEAKDRKEFKKIKTGSMVRQTKDHFESKEKDIFVLRGLKEDVLGVVFLSKHQIIAQIHCI